MAYTNILPRTESIVGSDLTGGDGTTDRTYTLPDVSDIISSGFAIIINGTSLHENVGLDFTVAGNIVTFLNIVDNTDVIRINYYISFGNISSATIITTEQLKYSTPILLADILGMKGEIPSWEIGTDPTKEEVGEGDNSKLVFYLDYQNVLSDSYTLYYGADQSTIDVLVETTDYTLDKDKGKITLTTDGKTLLGTNKLFAEYCFLNNGMANSYLVSVLSRAEREVENAINAVFTNGSQTNPPYPITIEIQPSQGFFQERIISEKKPLKDIASFLDADITDTDNAITITSESGGEKFPLTGYLIIGSEVITYTGITGDTFTGCSRGVLDTTAIAHSSGDSVHTTILFRSDTTEGNPVNWTIQSWNTMMDATEAGLIYKFRNSSPDFLANQGVANRIKIIYLYGYDTVPEDITRLTLIFAKRQLVQDNIGKAIIAGRNEFRPEMFNADLGEIERIINSYIVFPMGNT